MLIQQLTGLDRLDLADRLQRRGLDPGIAGLAVVVEPTDPARALKETPEAI